MASDKVFSLLGLCRRAGRLAWGEEKSLKSIREKRAHLVLLAVDASGNTRKRIMDKCVFYSIAYVSFSTLSELGAVTGADARAVVSVLDKGFAAAIQKEL
jgi:ribosomal protein L7Ae-like RNA K-turn-binding protein